MRRNRRVLDGKPQIAEAHTQQLFITQSNPRPSTAASRRGGARGGCVAPGGAWQRHTWLAETQRENSRKRAYPSACALSAAYRTSRRGSRAVVRGSLPAEAEKSVSEQPVGVALEPVSLHKTVTPQGRYGTRGVVCP